MGIKTQATIGLRVENLINKTAYSQVKLCGIPHRAIETWSRKRVPSLVAAYVKNEWDMNMPTTWEEIAVTNTVVSFYGKRVACYFTYSYNDYTQAKIFIYSTAGKSYRKQVGFDYHFVVLLSPEIFFISEDLDTFWASINSSNTGAAALDFSHYDDDELLEPEYILKGFGYLTETE